MATATTDNHKPPWRMQTASLGLCRPLQTLLLGALLAGLALTGCGLSPRQQQEAHHHTARDQELTCPEQRADRCAMVSPVWELAGSPPAELALLEDPHVALLARIHAIRAAQRSIEVQTYIFAPDASGKLVLSELLAAGACGC